MESVTFAPVFGRLNFVNVSPGAGGVKVLEGESVGVDIAVAGGAVWIGTMGVKELADGLGLTDVRFFNLHIGGRGRGMDAEEVFHDVDGAVYRRGKEAISSGGKEGAHTEKPSAAAVKEDVFAKVGILRYAEHVVELGEVGVDEAVVGGEEFGQRSVVLYGVAEELKGFLDHVFAEVLTVVEAVFVGVGRHEIDVTESKPAMGESPQEGVSLTCI